MVKRKTGDKLGDIRLATIAEVVERGSSAASVNAIAKRAGLAVGTLYRYYENKEHLLRAVYLAVKTDLHTAMMSAVANAPDSKSRIRAMWFSLLSFSHARPQDFLFAEVIINDTFLTAEDLKQIEAMSAESRGFITAAIEDGSVRDLDTRAIVTVLAAPAMQLGRSAALSGEMPDPDRAEEIFGLCWHAIKA